MILHSVLKIQNLVLGSLSVNVSVTTSKDEYINEGQTSVSSSEIRILSRLLLPVSIVALSMHILIFLRTPFL